MIYSYDTFIDLFDEIRKTITVKISNHFFGFVDGGTYISITAKATNFNTGSKNRNWDNGRISSRAVTTSGNRNRFRIEIKTTPSTHIPKAITSVNFDL